MIFCLLTGLNEIIKKNKARFSVWPQIIFLSSSQLIIIIYNSVTLNKRDVGELDTRPFGRWYLIPGSSAYNTLLLLLFVL